MKLMSFKTPDGRAAYGRVEGERVVDLSTGVGAPADLKSALAAGDLGSLTDGQAFELSAITYLPVIPNPSKIFCVGHNYESHRKETGRDAVEHPSIFTRFADTLTAHDTAVLKPKVSGDVDYEAELAVIIGKPGRAISEDEAMSHVAGFACFNDVSIRDWQWHTRQFTPGKNFPTTGPFGPWMVTPDEIDDLSSVRVRSLLNGQVMQDQPIADLIFPIARVISYISAFTPLSVGDVIATGTPGGVGAKRTPPVWMKPGDEIVIDCGPVGRLVNRITEEA